MFGERRIYLSAANSAKKIRISCAAKLYTLKTLSLRALCNSRIAALAVLFGECFETAGSNVFNSSFSCINPSSLSVNCFE